jgi:hypothetical protein
MGNKQSEDSRHSSGRENKGNMNQAIPDQYETFGAFSWLIGAGALAMGAD